LIEDDYDTATAVITNSFEKRRGNLRSKDSYLLPHIDSSENKIYVPDTFGKDDNVIMASMVTLAKSLEYDVVKLPYGERKYETPVDAAWQVATGIGFCSLDYETKFLIKDKADMYEFGRTVARSQQMLGYFNTEEKLGLDALKRDHTWFGNNPNQTVTVGKTQYPVNYVGKTLESCFAEVEWASYLAPMYLVLLRKSHKFLSEDVKVSTTKDIMLQYTEVQDLFAKRETVLVPQKGKTAAVKVRKVPKKPKANSLLTKPEMSFVDQTISKVFNAIASSSRDEWYDFIFTHGFSQIKKRIVENATVRSQILQRFASMTTKRLNEIRNSGAHLKTVRKRDVRPKDLIDMLLRRSDLNSKFADELITLDPNFENVLTDFKKVRANTESVDFVTSRQTLINFISNLKLYVFDEKVVEKVLHDNLVKEFVKYYEANQDGILGYILTKFKESKVGLPFTSVEELEVIVDSVLDYTKGKTWNHTKWPGVANDWLSAFIKVNPSLGKRVKERLSI